jgi:hypothetical protein
MTVDFYTIPQQITLVMASLISGSVSLLASLTIIFIIWRDRHKKLKFVYHRILFAISIIDVIISLSFAFSFLAVPSGIFWGAQGNTASCAASGFLQHLYTSQGLYNFGLAVYYLMISRYGKTQEFVSRFIEPYVHAVSLCVPIGLGCWLIFLDVLNPYLRIGGWCGIAMYPPGCSEIGSGNCTRGEMADTVRFIISIGTVFPPLMGIAAIMIMIICHVRGQHAAVTQYHTRLNWIEQLPKQCGKQCYTFGSALSLALLSLPAYLCKVMDRSPCSSLRS